MTSDPWEQGLDSDDYVEGIDDEEEELGIDYHTAPLEDYDASGESAASMSTSPASAAAMSAPAPQPQRQRRRNGRSPKYRIRVMGAKLRARFPGVESILITKSNGAQVLLVRKGG